MKRETHPAAALGHPLFAIALIVLVLNDHALKGAGILPPIVTGKLSDVAGLLVAPAVLAWLCRARTWRGWLAAHVVVGAGFTALELAPALVSRVESASAWVGLPMRMWPDPTDLLALPALAISLVVLRTERRPASALIEERSGVTVDRHLPPSAGVGMPSRRGATHVIGVFALVACTATSQSSPPPRYPFRPRGVIEADLVLRHTGSTDLAVSVRRLRDGLEVDCDGLLEAPHQMLDASDFTEAKEWTLARGDGVPLWDRFDGAPTRECYAVRLTAHGQEWLLTWRHGTPPVAERELRLEPDVPAEPTAVVLNEGDVPPRVPPGVTVRHP
jgi:hypothetical protein